MSTTPSVRHESAGGKLQIPLCFNIQPREGMDVEMASVSAGACQRTIRVWGWNLDKICMTKLTDFLAFISDEQFPQWDILCLQEVIQSHVAESPDEPFKQQVTQIGQKLLGSHDVYLAPCKGGRYCYAIVVNT